MKYHLTQIKINNMKMMKMMKNPLKIKDMKNQMNVPKNKKK